MKPSLRILTACLALILLLSACSRGPKPLAPDAQPGQVPEIAGDYVINGFDPTGIEYGGRLRISAGAQPGQYLLQWIISGDLQEGVGTLDGNRLTVEWRSTIGMGRQGQGTAAYTVTRAGELYGERQVDGYTAPGTETAYPNTAENMSN
ncbi:MAG: hypothetical protein ACKOC5_10340 [Chloroflexota bacterium]